jgi:hypothetical protein
MRKRKNGFVPVAMVSYFPNKGEKVKRANKFETPGPMTDSHGNITGEKTPIVSMVEDGPTTRPRKSVFPLLGANVGNLTIRL